MIRSIARLTALLAALAAASPVLAQEKGAQERGRLGLGISLTPFNLVGTDLAMPVPATADVSLNFDLGAFRLEPSLGIATYSVDAGPKASSFNLGCGLLIPVRPSRTVSVYVGPRLFLGFVSAKNGGGFSSSGLDLTLAGVLGAEWFADPRFSIGAEARLSYLNLPELSDAGVVLRPAASTFGTSGHVYFRFYL